MSAWATRGLIVGLLSLAMAQVNAEPRIRIYQPAFLSKEDPVLGQNIGSVINTAIWKTFRKLPNQPNAILVGDANAVIADRALELGRQKGAQLVVWGDAFKYGDGGVGNAHIDILAPSEADRSAQVWKVSLKVGERRFEVTSDVFPERSLYFQPLLFSGKLLRTYADAVVDNVYSDPQGSKVLGKVTSDVNALEFATNYTKVSIPDPHNPNGPPLVGYMLLPPLAEGTSAVTNFSGAIVAVLRERWDWAIYLLNAVEADKQTPTNIEIDAKLLHAFCLLQLGRPARTLVEEALVLNPTARRTQMVKVMLRLTELVKAGGEVASFSEQDVQQLETATRIAELETGPEDRWMQSVNALLEAMHESLRKQSIASSK